MYTHIYTYVFIYVYVYICGLSAISCLQSYHQYDATVSSMLLSMITYIVGVTHVRNQQNNKEHDMYIHICICICIYICIHIYIYTYMYIYIYMYPYIHMFIYING